MRRALLLAALLALCGVALWHGQRHRADGSASARAGVNLVADAEREISRVPMRLTRLSDAEEVAIGDEMADSFHRNATMDRERQALVDEIGRALGAHAHRALPWRFHLVDDAGMVNAFALPGGHVYVGRGLMDLFDSKDQLAAVLGHEIEHVDHYHCAERVQLEARVRNLPLSELAMLPLELFEAGYSKEQELEADREGARLAVRSGYSAAGALHAYERLAKKYPQVSVQDRSPQEEMSRVALEGVFGYFRSHPEPEERVRQMRALIREEQWKLGEEQKFR